MNQRICFNLPALAMAFVIYGGGYAMEAQAEALRDIVDELGVTDAVREEAYRIMADRLTPTTPVLEAGHIIDAAFSAAYDTLENGEPHQ